MNAYFVPGSAYMTFQFTQATVNIQTQNNINILTFNGQQISTTPASFSGNFFKTFTFCWFSFYVGTKFTLQNSLGMTYIIYALTSVTFSVTSTVIATPSVYSGIIRFAALNSTDPAAQSALDDSSATYATSMF